MKVGVRIEKARWKDGFMAALTKVLFVGEQKVLCQNNMMDSLVMPLG